ncbi:MAG: trimethylamine methyltransferase family protein [Kiloniellales bacterium]
MARTAGPRASGRRGRRETRGKGIARLPWRSVVNRLPPIEVLSADQVEAIHQASLRVLSEIGMRVLCPEARSLLGAAGAEVDEAARNVRFDPALVEAEIAKAPASFTIRARNPAKTVTIGGNHINFSMVGGPSFVSDLDRGRRPGTFAELCDFQRIGQMLDIIHTTNCSPFEPLDLPPETRHLDRYYAAARLADKVWSASLLGGFRARDGLAMIAIAHGIDEDALPQQPLVFGNINTNSPRQLDVAMAQGLMALARAGQPVVVTPFTLSGAMAPATLAGALTQQNAEALAGMALAQVVRPGAPVVYGGFTSNVDMKSGAPAFGTPEYTKAAQATGQLARRYRVPYRSSSTNASNAVDAQAAYESEMSLWGAVMGHANMIFHSAGWLESGLTASFEKLIVDAEMLQMMAEYLTPIAVDEDQLAIEAIREVAPGGHFFGSVHTLARYETAFYAPLLSDWRNFETWRDGGSLDTAKRANAIWKRLLADYEPPPLDPAIDEALQAYVARRKEELARDPQSAA